MAKKLYRMLAVLTALCILLAGVPAGAERADPASVLNWYITLAELRKEHPELTGGDYTELFPEHGQIFAYTRETKEAKAIILINLSTEPAEYDAACLENAELLLGTTGTETRGWLALLEAVIYEAVSPE